MSGASLFDSGASHYTSIFCFPFWCMYFYCFALAADFLVFGRKMSFELQKLCPSIYWLEKLVHYIILNPLPTSSVPLRRDVLDYFSWRVMYSHHI